MVNEALPFVSEFYARKKLAPLGFVSSFDDLNSFKADVFLMIDSEISKIEIEESKKKKWRK